MSIGVRPVLKKDQSAMARSTTNSDSARIFGSSASGMNEAGGTMPQVG